MTEITIVQNTSYLAVFVYYTLSHIGIVPGTMALLAALMLIDVVTGIIRSSANQGPRSIRSETARKGIIAKFLLLLAVLSVGLTATLLGYSPATYVQAAITVLALGELYSIMGNIHSARTGKPKVEFDAISVILKKIKSIINKLDIA